MYGERGCRFAIVILGLWAILAGCGGNSGQPELGEVTGTVFYEGMALPNVSVTFTPVDGRPATAITDQFGSYKLVYIRDTTGCKVGLNKVSIDNGEGALEGEEAEGDDVDQTQVLAGYVEIPAKYNVNTTLQAEVKSGENVFDFYLEK